MTKIVKIRTVFFFNAINVIILGTNAFKLRIKKSKGVLNHKKSR